MRGNNASMSHDTFADAVDQLGSGVWRELPQSRLGAKVRRVVVGRKGDLEEVSAGLDVLEEPACRDVVREVAYPVGMLRTGIHPFSSDSRPVVLDLPPERARARRDHPRRGNEDQMATTTKQLRGLREPHAGIDPMKGVDRDDCIKPALARLDVLERWPLDLD